MTPSPKKKTKKEKEDKFFMPEIPSWFGFESYGVTKE